jgi:predicted amidohydrolase
VATIVGFTEIDRLGRLFNSAAVVSGGTIVGVYRKLHPAIRRSVYQAGDAMPVFTVAGLTFGIIICLDSTYAEPARSMATRGAAALFVPTNNGLPAVKAGPELAAEARKVDIARATENGVSVIRADVVGSTSELASYGSSGIVGPDGTVLASAAGDDLLIAEIETAPRRAGTRRSNPAPAC